MQSRKNKLILALLEILSWGGTAMLIVGVLTHVHALRAVGLGDFGRLATNPVVLAWGLSGCILRMKFKEYKEQYKLSEDFKPFGTRIALITVTLIVLGLVCLFIYVWT